MRVNQVWSIDVAGIIRGDEAVERNYDVIAEDAETAARKLKRHLRRHRPTMRGERMVGARIESVRALCSIDVW